MPRPSLLFTMVCDLQAKVEVLTERSKNTGVIFDRKAFSSETEFVLWFMSKNPSGEGLAGFVDIILFWAFSISDVGDASQFLIEVTIESFDDHWVMIAAAENVTINFQEVQCLPAHPKKLAVFIEDNGVAQAKS